MAPHWTLIRNPKAASGKANAAWLRIQPLLSSHGIQYSVLETQSPGHATRLAREAIERGARHLVAVGGDGTVNEVANGILVQSAVPSSSIVLGQIPVGSGKDWGRTVGIPSRYDAAVSVLKQGKDIVQDVGSVHFTHKGQDKSRYFVNIAGMGFDAFVGEVANRKKAAGKGGIMGYISALLTSLKQYKSLPAAYTVDGDTHAKTMVFSLVAGICQYNGGGMKQCPDALIDDGLLDLTLIRDLPKWKVIRHIPGLFTGKFVKDKVVFQAQGKIILIESPEMMIEVDGENIGTGSCTFQAHPKMLTVRVNN